MSERESWSQRPLLSFSCWRPLIRKSPRIFRLRGGLPPVPGPRAELLPALLLPPTVTQITDCRALWTKLLSSCCRSVLLSRPLTSVLALKRKEETVTAERHPGGMGSDVSCLSHTNQESNKANGVFQFGVSGHLQVHFWCWSAEFYHLLMEYSVKSS